MLEGLAHLTGGNWAGLEGVAHGSTVATNAILERKGANVAFVTTQGFQDVLHIGRQNRPHLYALAPQIPTPLIATEHSYEAIERLDHRGEVLLALDETSLDRTLDRIAKGNYDAIAVCLLYSFLNPTHEQVIRQRIVERGIVEAWQVALSSDVLPEFREYERASTTALEAYVRPLMARYVSDLRAQLPPSVRLRIMKSDGGIMHAENIRERAVLTALSGPSAGVMGAFALAKQAGEAQIITLDMGGTSTDVALCEGDVPVAPHSQIDGLPLRARLLDIETIGAGGGSVAWVDSGGALRVGPHSAGATPGAAAYGRGGTLPTVTDANVVLGRIPETGFLGGAMTLSTSLARESLLPITRTLNMSVEQVASGVIAVANANIERAVRRVSVARGKDPRFFTLVAFGGAGGLHACEMATRLEMKRVMIPRASGVLCALGLLMADVRVDHSRPVLARATRGIIAQVRAMQAELLSLGRDDLRREGIRDDAMTFKVSLDMRYRGQAYELTVPLEGDVVRSFHLAHEVAYGHALEGREVEIITLRMQAIGRLPKPVLEQFALGNPDSTPAHMGQTHEGFHIYNRDALKAGMRFRGGALVLQMDGTVYVPDGWTASVDPFLHLILAHEGQ